MTPAQLLQRAFAAHRAGQFDAAARDYAQVRRLAPQAFDAWHLSGTLELQRNSPRLALDLLARARQLKPADATCAMRHGIALQALGRLVEAGAAFQAAVQADARHAEAHDRLGSLTLITHGHAAAVPHFRAATVANPDWPQAWCNLGIALVYTGELAAAEAALDRALTLDPALPKAHTARALLLQQSYRLPEAAAAFGAALALDPHDLEARSGRLLTLHYLDDITPAQLATEHRAFGEQLAPLEDRTTASLRLQPDAPAPSRLRVAFISQDLRRHSVAWFLLPLLQHLDRDAFEILLLHDHHLEDDISQTLRQLADHWENIHGQSDAAVTQRLRALRPHLAIDLAGHTGLHRLGVFARRIAPLQINYLGYPDTTGLSSMDYRLVDAYTDPIEPASEARASEQLVRFADTLWSYAPPPEAETSVAPPPVAVPPARPPTFGSFNALTKVSDATIALWSQLLNQVPASRLVLKSAGLEQTDLADTVRRRFAAHGIDTARLDLRGRTSDTMSHLALYREIDVALDPLPYHGTTTTCEALWMGRPVVTLAGDRHANRVGVSLLNAVGHPEWIAANPDDYLRIARELITDREKLARLSTGLRAELQASPLMDHAGQAARFGATLRHLWLNAAAPQATAAVAVAVA